MCHKKKQPCFFHELYKGATAPFSMPILSLVSKGSNGIRESTDLGSLLLFLFLLMLSHDSSHCSNVGSDAFMHPLCALEEHCSKGRTVGKIIPQCLKRRQMDILFVLSPKWPFWFFLSDVITWQLSG